MFRPVPLILILAVMLTSIGLGAARGTVRLDDRIVLCTGHGVVVIPRPDGQGERAHLCPDMALSLMAGLSPADPVLPQRVAVPRLLFPDQGLAAAAQARTQVRVRDPPRDARA